METRRFSQGRLVLVAAIALAAAAAQQGSKRPLTHADYGNSVAGLSRPVPDAVGVQ